MSKAWERGSTTAWRKVRAAVLSRDGYRCRAHADGWCAQRKGTHVCRSRADSAHHVHGREITGDDPRFIVASCTPCNLHIGDPTTLPDPPPRLLTRW